MRIPSLVLITLLVSACAPTFQKDALTEQQTKLSRDKSIVIATPHDGNFEKIVYENSATMTANAVINAFAPYSHEVFILNECHDIACLKNQSSHTYGYLVLPEIVHWEDRATEWSGKPDKIAVKITVFDGLDKIEIASALLHGKSKWLTFGGDHPQDLLQEPINGYVSSLY